MLRGVLIAYLILAGSCFVFPHEYADTLDVEPVYNDRQLEVPAISPKESEIKSPVLALTLSAVLPGAGQIYNGSYWKTPIILGFAGYFTYAIIVLQDFYSDYRQRFRDSITDQNQTGDSQLRFIRDFYRDQRDRFAWYMGFLYLINLLDAYVEATLSGFDVGEDLTLRMIPYVDLNGSTGIQFRISF
jgi:hypothetical protein